MAHQQLNGVAQRHGNSDTLLAIAQHASQACNHATQQQPDRLMVCEHIGEQRKAMHLKTAAPARPWHGSCDCMHAGMHGAACDIGLLLDSHALCGVVCLGVLQLCLMSKGLATGLCGRGLHYLRVGYTMHNCRQQNSFESCNVTIPDDCSAAWSLRSGCVTSLARRDVKPRFERRHTVALSTPVRNADRWSSAFVWLLEGGNASVVLLVDVTQCSRALAARALPAQVSAVCCTAVGSLRQRVTTTA